MNQHLQTVCAALAQSGAVFVLEELLLEACRMRASDIHFEPKKSDVLVLFRIDGVVNLVARFAVATYPELVARIKVLAHIRIDEHMLPQDGRFSFARNQTDIRVSTLPSLYGENVVLRLLVQGSRKTLQSLGFSAAHQEILEKAAHARGGMVLVVGPTGCGKTTTLHALLALVENRNLSIVAIEDPIEYENSHVCHVAVRERISLTFSNALRAVLRQDPDIILVGEIRDSETAQIATRAALTGHLVFSTLHTQNALGSITRLADMGMERYAIASVLRAVVSQRLVRRLCVCKKSREPTMRELEIFDTHALPLPEILYEPGGCEQCLFRGFCGRIVVAEVLQCTEEIKQQCAAHATVEILTQVAMRSGFVPLMHDALQKIYEGNTTVEEVLAHVD